MPSCVLAAHLRTFSASPTAFLGRRDQGCTQRSQRGCIGGEKKALSYSHYPSWLWTVFLIMGSISLALLPATLHWPGDFRDLSATTPEPQPPLPSRAQRHRLDYLPYGHHRTLNLLCHLFYSFHFVSHIWRCVPLAQRPTTQKSFPPPKTVEINCTVPVTGSLMKTSIPPGINTRMPWPPCSLHFALLDFLPMNVSNHFSNPCKLLTSRGNRANDSQSRTPLCTKKHPCPFACFEPSPNNFTEPDYLF